LIKLFSLIGGSWNRYRFRTDDSYTDTRAYAVAVQHVRTTDSKVQIDEKFPGGIVAAILGGRWIITRRQIC